LALFSQYNLGASIPLNGRFYGGAWGQGQVDYDELTTLQDYLGTLLEPDIDPTDVTAYANVYEMLGAQTAAALFDINDKTSLRVETNGSGGVPVEGDPVGVMMDVSGTGGLTMQAYLDGATELVTNGGFDTDTSGWTLGGSSNYSAGAVNIDVPSVTVALEQAGFAPIINKTYVVSFEITSYTSGSLRFLFAGFSSSYVSTTGVFSFVLNATSTSNVLTFINGGTPFTGTIDNISVKALPGYTAVAASDAARPTLKTYNSPISSREILTTTYSWNITDGGRA